MKWNVDVNYEQGIITISEDTKVITWAHTQGDTPVNHQLVRAFTDLAESHNRLIKSIEGTLDIMIPADPRSMLRGLEHMGYLVASTEVTTE